MITTNCTFHPHSVCECIIGGMPRSFTVNMPIGYWAPYDPEPIKLKRLPTEELDQRLKRLEELLDSLDQKIAELRNVQPFPLMPFPTYPTYPQLPWTLVSYGGKYM